MIKHLACMMDGNRRWATQQGLRTLLGHRAGLDAVKRVVQFCLDKKIAYLSLYTFSLENFKRSQEEKEYLFSLIATEVQKGIPEFIEHGIRVRFIGDRTLFPAHVVAACNDVEQRTAHGQSLQLNFLFCYGARQEIVHSVKEIAQKVLDGTLSLDDISQEQVSKHLWTKDMPEPEIIVRPGNVMRLSNFLLYQSAYSEYYFLECLWPDMTAQHLETILADFNNRQRRFGA